VKTIPSLNTESTPIRAQKTSRPKGLASLQVLDLRRTDVTDAGLESLQGLVKLQSLDLTETEVTDDAAQSLQQDLPKLDILRRAAERAACGARMINQ
jgi:tRNA U55 pseudouridine synthase TruB